MTAHNPEIKRSRKIHLPEVGVSDAKHNNASASKLDGGSGEVTLEVQIIGITSHAVHGAAVGSVSGTYL